MEGIEQHDDQHALVHTKICLGFPEAEVENDRQGPGTLPGFFLQIREDPRLSRRPGDGAIRSNSNSPDAKPVILLIDEALGYPLAFPVGIDPPTSQRLDAQRFSRWIV